MKTIVAKNSLGLGLALLTIIFTVFISCNQSSIRTYEPNNKNITYAGRVDPIEQEVILIGAASSATAYFEGDTCVIILRNYNEHGQHNYFSIEIDGEDLGRFRMEGSEMLEIPVEIPFPAESHKISIFKLTEAANGYINFGGIKCKKIIKPKPQPTQSIEFIGNSITCGMGNDTTQIACGRGLWYDQHNAYWAYGSTVSRALNVDFLLSSVSGIGMYRNWNSPEPTMPQVYSNLYLKQDEKQPFTTNNFNPDIVSICLGTNDLSDGDGTNKRLPFDENIFTENYIQFVEHILERYPDTQIALLTSPMIQGEKHEIFLSCLTKVKNHFSESSLKEPQIFVFEPFVPSGCDYHPDINDHIFMAEQLYSFYKNLLNN
ncbi:MAG: GDSL-type esterase/lipase family protein [Prolixibacteraceae bacterium]|jgi:lysophospholipase L1-like esterase|nr:GDSL-type esterase/lipase family protein [Prolixibacteraceae bacterium]